MTILLALINITFHITYIMVLDSVTASDVKDDRPPELIEKSIIDLASIDIEQRVTRCLRIQYYRT